MKMKFLLALAIIFIVLTAVYGETDPWKDYKKQHGKDYKESQDGGKEDAKRKQIFLATDAKINKHNSQKNVTFQLGHNKFSDMTSDELTNYVGLVMPANASRSLEPILTIDTMERQFSDSLDYRTSICMPAVKNQGSCGSCWAFTAITPLEFAKCMKFGSPVVLSEQQLVDCDTSNGGCGGGWYSSAWIYLKNGSAKQSFYPYTISQSTCKFSTQMIGARVASFGYINTLSVYQMQEALQTYGPIAAAITVIDSFYSYKNGVYSDKACDDMGVNHGVVIVGWGTLNGVNYWIVRNSWGTNWGMSGYILMQRGVNKCSIETYPAAIASVV